MRRKRRGRNNGGSVVLVAVDQVAAINCVDSLACPGELLNNT